MELYAYGAGLLTLVAIWIIAGVLSTTWNPLGFIQGADNRPSTSKFQWFLWLVVVLFAYVAIYAARIQRGHFEAIGALPSNVLVALGLSTGTMVLAKGITVNQIRNGIITKTNGSGGIGAIFQDDNGFPDLSKLQLMAWTFVALAVYILITANKVHTVIAQSNIDPGTVTMPDIDGALLALMGIGQGGYIAKKLLPAGPAMAPSLTSIRSVTTAGIRSDGPATDSKVLSGTPAEPSWHG